MSKLFLISIFKHTILLMPFFRSDAKKPAPHTQKEWQTKVYMTPQTVEEFTEPVQAPTVNTTSIHQTN